MGRRKKYKVGDRVFFEFYDGSIGSAIVRQVIPDTYIDVDNKPYHFDMLKTGDNTSIEDYATLPYSDPRVKALIKQFKKQDEIADLVRDFVIANSDIYDTETIAKALAQVAIEYGWQYDDL